MKEKTIKITIAFVLIISLFFNYQITPVKGYNSLANGNVSIRVGLTSGITMAKIRVEKGSYNLVDESTGFIIFQARPGSLLTIVKKGPVLDVEVENNPLSITYKGPLVLIPEDENSLNVVSFSNTLYRDAFQFHNENEGISVINKLALERYLYGIVGPEMGASAEIEALKAQAVVSRSYALSCLNSGKKFDVTNNTSSQVYKGYSAEIGGGSNAVQAVDGTVGEVIYYENTLVQAFYHANAGGYTASSENVWHNSLPYLKATPSPYDSYAFDYPHQSGGWPANTYKWEKTVSVPEAQQMIDRFNQNSGSMSIGNLVNLSTIKLDYTTQGTPLCDRVTELEVYGSNGVGKVIKDQIRNIFELKSTKFDIKIDSAVYIKNGSNATVQMNSAHGLKVIGRDGLITEVNGNSNQFTVKNNIATKQIPKTFSEITFDGYGNGHGVGMSQWGARGMAANGYNYKDIIEHYYNQGNYDGKLKILNYYTRGN
ncbi:MAG: hypothetical protein APF76_08315 [Desulfitibacter sp. BRH_c19]|nr:MAG: hypothetical protein APF76_08315 [Desulfitibacter sp. BRH_c19]